MKYIFFEHIYNFLCTVRVCLSVCVCARVFVCVCVHLCSPAQIGKSYGTIVSCLPKLCG